MQTNKKAEKTPQNAAKRRACVIQTGMGGPGQVRGAVVDAPSPCTMNMYVMYATRKRVQDHYCCSIMQHPQHTRAGKVTNEA